MNILIIYAHPNAESFNYAILNTLKNSISSQNNTKILDLNKENFDPVLRFDKENKRRDLKDDPATLELRSQLTWADHLIFIFPIWWGGMPAILKGYIDRVFAKGFAYEYKGTIPVGLFPEKTAAIITTHDTPGFYANFFQQDYGKVLKKQVLKMCGIKTNTFIVFPFTRNSNQQKRNTFLSKISAYANNL